jgi:hypothetical protein
MYAGECLNRGAAERPAPGVETRKDRLPRLRRMVTLALREAGEPRNFAAWQSN